MFYVKWFGQVLLILMTVSAVGFTQPEPQVSALIGITLIVWCVVLLARLTRHLSKRVPNQAGVGDDVANERDGHAGA